MSENDEDSLIGYDPLAWLHEASEQETVQPLPVELPSDKNEAIDEETFSESDAETMAVDELDDQQPLDLATDASAFKTETKQIVLDSTQTIQNVAELYERLLHALDNSHKIDIDASAVTTVDTTTLQLLLVLKQTAVKMQKQVTIDFPSERFIEAAELLNLAELLNVDQAAAGFF